MTGTLRPKSSGGHTLSGRPWARFTASLQHQALYLQGIGQRLRDEVR